MNFQNLEYFIITAREGNITRAAERLNISQQALSGSISRLEKELDCTLFERRPDFTLTYSGKCFLEKARQMLDIKEQSRVMLEDINDNTRGELKIGVSHTRGQAILPMLLPAFGKKYPKAELSVTEASTRDLEASLEKGKIDVMIGYMPAGTPLAVMKPLFTDRFMMIIPKTVLAANFGDGADGICEKYNKTRDLSLFADIPFILLRENERIRTIVDRRFHENGIRPRVRTETQNIQTAFSLSIEGLGACIIPEMYLKSRYAVPGLYADEITRKAVCLPFSAGDEGDTIGIGYNSDRYLSRLARDFIDMSLERYKNGWKDE